MARNTFFVVVAAAGLVLAMAVAQVPQPWRGVLVAWLIFGGSAGYLAARLLRGYRAYVAAPPTRATRTQRARRAHAAPSPRATSLKVVVSRAAANGRRTI